MGYPSPKVLSNHSQWKNDKPRAPFIYIRKVPRNYLFIFENSLATIYFRFPLDKNQKEKLISKTHFFLRTHKFTCTLYNTE